MEEPKTPADFIRKWDPNGTRGFDLDEHIKELKRKNSEQYSYEDAKK